MGKYGKAGSRMGVGEQRSPKKEGLVFQKKWLRSKQRACAQYQSSGRDSQAAAHWMTCGAEAKAKIGHYIAFLSLAEQNLVSSLEKSSLNVKKSNNQPVLCLKMTKIAFF